MNIKFLDLNLQSRNIKTKILNSIKYNIENSHFINGPGVKKFEKQFSKYLSARYCLGVANGTDALEISIKSLNLRDNSEILVPANTWISTAEAVLNAGHKVKFVDCDLSHNICVVDLCQKITRKTKAVIFVHLYGNPTNIEKVKKICEKNSIKLIEDCAQSHGASFKGKKTSSFGHLSTFSFFPSKNLGCYGDGGAIVTNSKNYFIKCKKIANHGGLKKNIHDILGRNSRLDTIQADILSIKLKKLNSWIKLRNFQSKLYKKFLEKIGDIEFIKNDRETVHSNHLFVIRTSKRNELKLFLEKKNIYTAINYPRTLPETPLFQKNHMNYCRKMNILKLNKKILSLPIGEHLKRKDIVHVSNMIKFFFNS